MRPLMVSPLDLPLRVTIVRWVALIIVVGRLIMIVCQHGGKCGPGLQAWFAVYSFAGPQVRSPHFTPGWKNISRVSGPGNWTMTCTRVVY